MSQQMIENLKSTTVTLGTYRSKTVLITTTKRGSKREAPRMGLDNQRIRFNWGYHDGASSLRNGYKTSEEAVVFVQHHFDRAYADGFAAGMRDQATGCYTNDSTAAWTASGRVDDFAGWRQ